MSKVEPITSLLKQLSLALKPFRFKQEENRVGFKIFSRKLDAYTERIGILSSSGEGRRGDFAFSVIMGAEFSDLEREPVWIGMPCAHGSVELRLLNKAAKREYVCSADTDLKELATHLADLIIKASEELQRRSEKLRKSYVSLVENRGSNARKRLTHFADRKAKELKQRSRKEKKTALPFRESVNIFEIASLLLKSRKDQRQDLEVRDFDDAEAHDRRLTQRIQQQFIETAKSLVAELESSLFAALETGVTEHKKLPVNGVCYFAYWHVGWRRLYVAVSHEDVGLPCCLLMGVVAR